MVGGYPGIPPWNTLAMAKTDAVEQAADELYGLTPGEFTRTRDERVKALRGDGDREAADAVKALRKPTVAAWALNQLVRRRHKAVETLLRAGRELRAAQEELVGGGERAAFRRSSPERCTRPLWTRRPPRSCAPAGSCASARPSEGSAASPRICPAAAPRNPNRRRPRLAGRPIGNPPWPPPRTPSAVSDLRRRGPTSVTPGASSSRPPRRW